MHLRALLDVLFVSDLCCRGVQCLHVCSYLNNVVLTHCQCFVYAFDPTVIFILSAVCCAYRRAIRFYVYLISSK